MSKIAIIGTAGRDMSKRPYMTQALWEWMVKDAISRVPEDAHLVSGGAAWADHLAVHLFLTGHARALTLHLPAPFDGKFVGPKDSAGTTANFYHLNFSMIRGVNSFIELARAIDNAAEVTYESAKVGYRSFKDRNSKVAKADTMLAYTFSNMSVPADGGTKDTWSKCKGHRTHISLPILSDHHTQ